MFIAPFFIFLSFAFGQTDEREYIIRKGDTLWDLAFSFLGDPFAWPQIWHQNQYIKDPNLIFPGDTLVISKSFTAPSANGLGNSNGNPSYSQTENGNQSFFSETKKTIESSGFTSVAQKKSLVSDSLERISDSLFTLAMRQQRFFTSEFLEKLGFLWFDKDEKGLVYPGNAVIGATKPSPGLNRYETETHQQFSDIEITLFPSAAYKIGDTVSIFHADEIITFGTATASLVRRVGRAIITKVSDRGATALLYKIWDVVQDGDRIDALFHHSDMTIDTIISPPVAVTGTVFKRVENTERPYLYHSFILDRGSKDGVAFGDIFAVLSQDKASLGKIKAIACALNLDKTSSTLVIEKLYSNDINAGDTAVLLKHIAFKK